MRFRQRKALYRSIDKTIGRIEIQYWKILGIVFAISGIFTVGWLLWQGPIMLLANRTRGVKPPQAGLTLKERVDEENSIRTTLAQILGGTAVLLGVYFTFRNVKAVERNLEISRDGQITERYTKAIEQFGNEKREICLGGIYALERIARDSQCDHWPIVEVFIAYLHEHSSKSKIETDEKPEAEIHAIMKVLGRRQWEHEAPKQQLILNHLYLRYLDLSNLNFEGVSFWSADLGGSTLEQVNFDSAIFICASLYNCNLSDARLRDVSASNVNGEHAAFIRAKAQGIDLQRAQLSGANFELADLRNAALDGCDLENAYLVKTDLRGANLNDANLQNADMTDADLRGVDLSTVRNLTEKQVDTAVVDKKTRLPVYLNETPVVGPA